MTDSPSFERLNYLLRPNKHIERKMVFDRLLRLQVELSIQSHRYIGFGSLWFIDFIFAHRLLKIRDMISIELAEYAQRAEFNRPYSAIEVRSGWSSDVLAEISNEEWKRPHTVWLDYDGLLDQTVVDDLELLTNKLPINSVVIVTVNASRRSYRRVQNSVTALAAIAEHLGKDAIPDDVELTKDALPDVSEANFPRVLGRALLNFIRHKIRISGRQEGSEAVAFVPIFNFCHKDGAEMVTVGGIFVAPDNSEAIRDTMERDGLEWGKDKNPVQTGLDLIQLTAKEKITLDRLLPYAGATFEQFALEQGLRLPESQYQKYKDHYLYFPVFTESFF